MRILMISPPSAKGQLGEFIDLGSVKYVTPERIGRARFRV
jgi:hypothetical protein